MTLTTRRPTGKPSWPMVVLAGREKAGKTWAALSASASELTDRTLYVGIGEDDPDEYGLIPGADFEIVQHDGTFDGILQAVRDVASLERGDKPHLLVVDSMTRLWELIVDNAQAIANKRANGRKTASGDYAISPDLWNVAAGQWADVMDAIRLHRGPSILTARLDEVMVMENGQPTKEKKWKVQAHKSLPFDAGVLVEMHERGHALITGTKSVTMSLEKPTEAPGFTIAELWTRLGITADTLMGERVHQGTVTDDISPEAIAKRWTDRARSQTTKAGFEQVYVAARDAGVDVEVLDAIKAVASEWSARQTQLDVDPGKVEPRPWVNEADAKEFSDEVAALLAEAKAAKAHARILTKLAEIQAAKPDRPSADPDAAWAATTVATPGEPEVADDAPMAPQGAEADE